VTDVRTVFRRTFPPIADSSENVVWDFHTWVLIRHIWIGFTLIPGGRMTFGLSTFDLTRVTNPASATENLDSFLSLNVYVWMGYLDQLTLTVVGGNASAVISGDAVTRHHGVLTS
jgi:hypothetical protein